MSGTPELAQVVTGPYPLYVRRTPSGAALDVGSLAEALLVELAVRYDADPDGVGKVLVDIARLAASVQSQGRYSQAQRKLDDRTEKLLKELGGAEQRLYGDQVQQLADTLGGAA